MSFLCSRGPRSRPGGGSAAWPTDQACERSTHEVRNGDEGLAARADPEESGGLQMVSLGDAPAP